jgi:hypothetical protein
LSLSCKLIGSSSRLFKNEFRVRTTQTNFLNLRPGQADGSGSILVVVVFNLYGHFGFVSALLNGGLVVAVLDFVVACFQRLPVHNHGLEESHTVTVGRAGNRERKGSECE